MFEKILIANRGDQPHSGAAAKLNCVATESGRYFAAEDAHV